MAVFVVHKYKAFKTAMQYQKLQYKSKNYNTELTTSGKLYLSKRKSAVHGEKEKKNMGKAKRDLGVDQNGVQKMMRKRDYLADMSGQFGMNLVANLIGQLTYFYTDKVGLAVGGVGVVMLIAKIVDAVTDLWFGNVIDHSKGGNKKYYRWILRMMIPYSILAALLFCVPIQAGQVPALIYACVTNILLSAVCGTLMGTPMSAFMVVRTNSQSERESMGVFRAVGGIWLRNGCCHSHYTDYQYIGR